MFREVISLASRGLPIRVFTLYGPVRGGLAREMRTGLPPVTRMGVPALADLLPSLWYWARRQPRLLVALSGAILCKPWYGLEKLGENLWALLCSLRLAKWCREEEIGHIHAPWACGPATAAWAASRLTGIPFSFTARAWDIHPPDGALPEKIRDAALIRSETRYNIPYLDRSAPGWRHKMTVTRNGVPMTAAGAAAVTMASPVRLLTIGRFVGKKGFPVLLQACRLLKAAGFDFRLVMAGSGPLERQLHRLVQRWGLGRQVRFPGFVPYDRVPELFMAADIFVMPCIIDSSMDRDGIPTVLLEALLHRVPVIASRLSGIPELIRHGETGVLAAPGDPGALARAVLNLCRDRKTAQRMAGRGHREVMERFDSRKNCEKILALYRSITPSETRVQQQAGGGP